MEKLIDNMSNELEKGKKKVDDLNFKKTKQFSFEDFRDSKILYDDKRVNESQEDSILNKETLYTSTYKNTFENDENEKDNILENSHDEDSF